MKRRQFHHYLPSSKTRRTDILGSSALPRSTDVTMNKEADVDINEKGE